MSEKQIIARERNWTKARLIGGLAFSYRALTPHEQEKVNEMRAIRDNLLKTWDEESVKLGFNPRKKKKR